MGSLPQRLVQRELALVGDVLHLQCCLHSGPGHPLPPVSNVQGDFVAPKPNHEPE